MLQPLYVARHTPDRSLGTRPTHSWEERKDFPLSKQTGVSVALTMYQEQKEDDDIRAELYARGFSKASAQSIMSKARIRLGMPRRPSGYPKGRVAKTLDEEFAGDCCEHVFRVVDVSQPLPKLPKTRIVVSYVLPWDHGDPPRNRSALARRLLKG